MSVSLDRSHDWPLLALELDCNAGCAVHADHCCWHVAMHAQPLERGPQQAPLDSVKSPLHVYKAHVQPLPTLPLPLADVLQADQLVHHRKVGPEACLAWGSQAVLLCVLQQALGEGAGVKAHDWLCNCKGL